MPISKEAKLAIALAGIATALAAGTYYVSMAPPASPKKRRKKTSGSDAREPNPLWSPAASLSIPQRSGGTPTTPSWDDVKDQAILAVRGAVDPARASFAEYWRTLVAYVYPETIDLSPEEWSAWSTRSEATLIRTDIEEYLASVGVGTRGWRFALWLRFDSVIDGCYEALAPHTDAIAQCVASEIYPNVEWPADDASPRWQQEMWASLLEKVDAYADGQG